MVKVDSYVIDTNANDICPQQFKEMLPNKKKIISSITVLSIANRFPINDSFISISSGAMW